MSNELHLADVERFSVSIVIPSLEPNDSLLRLLTSLENQEMNFRQIVIVDQSDSLDAVGILNGYRGSLRDHVQVVSSKPGLSKARNAGLLALEPGWDVVLLPDDDVWMAPGIGRAIEIALRNGNTAGSGRLRPEDPSKGTRIAFPDEEKQITARNVWRTSIEACYFLTPSFLSDVGLYDETLGLGAKSPWQSGEGTDLLLRGLAAGHKISFVPDYELIEGDSPTLVQLHNNTRLRKYARGTGRVFAQNYSKWSCAKLIFRSLARLVVQSPQGADAIKRNSQILLGRLEGLLGRAI
ncbi:glycosyltransferase family 2 protein [Pseudarthrobacter sp. NPDC092184]|uniref:glycosyltransferase family 2 protein n=1 Tax=unclassified Pseudarthrobacter TaxID=2647000 RepID=UPI003814028B